METPEVAKKFFASYASEDRMIVEPFVKLLRLSTPVFWDRDSITPGSNWEDSIEHAVVECTHFILFWSSRASISEWVEREMNAALKAERVVIPLLLDGTAMPMDLSQFQGLDFRGLSNAVRSSSTEQSCLLNNFVQRLESAIEPNPIHKIINLLIQYERVFRLIHEADTVEAMKEHMPKWRQCHQGVWGTNGNDRNLIIRRLADPAKQWLARLNSPYIRLEDFDLVEATVHELSEFAISGYPMSMPTIYSNEFQTESQLWERWNKQAESYFRLRDNIARLKELAGRAGHAWQESDG